ncbi:MAG: NnrS family protein [Bacteroidales bacterium]|nr:NnrS family protein [Bacteroidales bacterium]
MFAALGWFLIAAVLNPVIFVLFEAAATEEQFLFNVSTFNIPYADIQLLGMAVMMIFGVSLQILSANFGLKQPSRRWRNTLLYGLNTALLVSVVTFIISMITEQRIWMGLYQLAVLFLLIIAIGNLRQFGIFKPAKSEQRNRGLKFIRAAYIWFFVAMVMLFMNPVYTFGIYMPSVDDAIPFSHAYFGAYRHALTVGFILMMIVGVSLRFVPQFRGVDLQKTRPLILSFVLLNAGNISRVSTEITTDFVPAAYSVMGISGFIEVVGLILWAVELIRNIFFDRR